MIRGISYSGAKQGELFKCTKIFSAFRLALYGSTPGSLRTSPAKRPHPRHCPGAIRAAGSTLFAVLEASRARDYLSCFFLSKSRGKLRTLSLPSTQTLRSRPLLVPRPRATGKAPKIDPFAVPTSFYVCCFFSIFFGPSQEQVCAP